MKETVLTQAEKIEGNKLLDAFIGHNRDFSDKLGWIAFADYHADWNKLMLVVEKIESLGAIGDISGMIGAYKIHIDAWDIKFIDFSNIDDHEENLIAEISRRECPTFIEAVWLAVVEFIKWFNNQQK